MALPSHISNGAEIAVDVVVVGSGVAGLVTALDLLDARPDLTVALIDKGAAGESGSTPLAQGGLAAAVGPDDSPALHAADTIRAGDHHTDRRAVAVMAAETPHRVADLQARGAVFDSEEDGRLALAREGGQSVHRSVRSADATGAEIFRALRNAAVARARSGSLTRLQGTAVALATGTGPDQPATGVWLLCDQIDGGMATPAQDFGLVLLRAKAVMLATGGCGGLYAGTTNRDGATADALAMAGAVGADLQDLEFVQFHPTGLKAADGRFQRFLLTEALRGAGAHLLDVNGLRFMIDRHPDAELAPRHIVAKAILDQPDGAWLDARMIPLRQLSEEFPTVLAGARTYGFDLATEPVPVEPCEHYMIGGVATDLMGRTSVPGLYAAGETASSGVHGANRMAGNSLAQSCVFAHRAALDMSANLPTAHLPADPDQPPGTVGGPDPDMTSLRGDLRRVMSAGAGAIRDADGLQTARKALEEFAGAAQAMWGSPNPPLTRQALETSSVMVAATAIVDSALTRTESRGAHFRLDHPTSVPVWAGRRQRVQLRP